MNIKIIRIHWSYPLLYEKVFYSNRVNNKGIYYISRKFASKESLLYIGKTNSSFYSRLNAHKYWINQYRGKVYVRLGTIISPNNCNDSLITDVESALIYEMKPFENTDKLNGYWYFNECKIINTGYRGVLPSVICMEDQI